MSGVAGGVAHTVQGVAVRRWVFTGISDSIVCMTMDGVIVYSRTVRGHVQTHNGTL